VSISRRNAKKFVIRKYEKGQKRFRPKKSIQTTSCEWEELEEWESINNNISDCQNSNITKDSYRNAQESLIENWKGILPKLLKIMVENNAPDKKYKCSKCENHAIVRCLDCGPNIYFCSYCEDLFHHNINIFHRKISLNQEKHNNDKILKLPQICSGNCKHEVFKILVIHLNGK